MKQPNRVKAAMRAGREAYRVSSFGRRPKAGIAVRERLIQGGGAFSRLARTALEPLHRSSARRYYLARVTRAESA
jgi:hypothetical protein